MDSAIPNYPLLDDQGRHVLSRDRRFQHDWYTSKRLDVNDINSWDDLANWQPQDVKPLNGVMAFWPDR
jgi:hypothetical protein